MGTGLEILSTHFGIVKKLHKDRRAMDTLLMHAFLYSQPSHNNQPRGLILRK
jgi:hypothetical protein